MNEIANRPTALPANFAEQLMKGIEDTRSTMAVSDGNKLLLRLLKSGIWVYGQANEEVQQGSRWAVNVASLARGWVCWGDGELLGQVMDSIQVPRPAQPADVDGVPFVEQYSMELTCLDGDDAGVLVLYKNNSRGFKIAFENLISAIRNQYAADPVHYWPIVTLHEESYPHKKYGEIFNPILTVVAWADAEGHMAGRPRAVEKPVEKPAEPPAAKPARARKTPLAAAPEPVEPVSTIQTHVGQRRRPVAR